MYFDIDNCSFIETNTTITENKTENNLITFFPNPACNKITIDLIKFCGQP